VDCHLSSLLGVPLSGSRSVHGLLLIAEFNDQDQQVAVAFTNQVTLAYERMGEQRRADEELVESKEVVEAMFESAPDAIAAVNEHGRIVWVNAQAQALFGYTRDELLGQLVEVLEVKGGGKEPSRCTNQFSEDDLLNFPLDTSSLFMKGLTKWRGRKNES
jgi:PAS domain-containing protein